ncbi:MAG: lysine--tRNA ligase [Phycisphaeraceae bacterium]|nr:lysine--tRNA ligase [Phycisphaeraceae bacterium]
MSEAPRKSDDGQAGETASEVSVLVAARRAKLEALRRDLGIEPYGQRVDGLVDLATARSRFSEADHHAHTEAVAAAKNAAGAPGSVAAAISDPRQVVKVAGRIMQHRDLGKLIFIFLRDHSGDLQVSISRNEVDAAAWELAKHLDYGDLVVAEGPIGRTNKGEICVWAKSLSMHAKSLVPPPEKFHGLSDPEIRYRRRAMDMYANPETMRTFALRSRLVTSVRRFMSERGYLEVETPMMQPIAGGAAARPFVTHHNALGIPLFLRVAPELYLKRLLVGGMPKVFEINRNFRNEGVDRSHNPEFTMMEAYQAFGDCWTMLELTESLIHELAVEVASLGREAPDGAKAVAEGDGPVLPFGDLQINYARPFTRVKYGELFERQFGFPMEDERAVRAEAQRRHVSDAARKDHWFLVDQLFEDHAEHLVDRARPTFITDYPSAISPLTRPNRAVPHLAERWDLFIAGMEIGPAYTELNDPDIQLAKFTEQLAGIDEEAQTFRSLDEDFLEALRVGMPPAGGLGLGIDRVVMLLANQPSIRDVILFPLMRPQ